MTSEVVRRWFKKMSQADAQRPNTGTNPTGHLTLTKSGFPIRHQTYFRQVFFGDLGWGPAHLAGRQREEVTVDFDVSVCGTPLGTFPLVVDYYPAYEADQGNRTSLLHWGSELSSILQSRDLVGMYATIEQTSSGHYRLIVDHGPTGPFMK